MNNKNGSFKQKAAVRGLYVTVIAAFAVLTASVIVSHYKTQDYEPLPTDTTDFSYQTNLAQAEKTDVPDERTTQRQTAVESSQSAIERETSFRPSAKKEETTAESTTQAVSSTFDYPCGNEILAHFSTVPVENKTMGDWRTHLGTDFKAEKGADVLSVGNGTVQKVISDTKLGYTIEIDHGTFTARYCGLAQDSAAKIGQSVEKGSVIGKLEGVPVESEEEPHLHLEIIKDSVKIDPETIF